MTTFQIELTDRCGVCELAEPFENLSFCWYVDRAGEVAWMGLACPICRETMAETFAAAGRRGGWRDG